MADESNNKQTPTPNDETEVKAFDKQESRNFLDRISSGIVTVFWGTVHFIGKTMRTLVFGYEHENLPKEEADATKKALKVKQYTKDNPNDKNKLDNTKDQDKQIDKDGQAEEQEKKSLVDIKINKDDILNPMPESFSAHINSMANIFDSFGMTVAANEANSDLYVYAKDENGEIKEDMCWVISASELWKGNADELKKIIYEIDNAKDIELAKQNKLEGNLPNDTRAAAKAIYITSVLRSNYTDIGKDQKAAYAYVKYDSVQKMMYSTTTQVFENNKESPALWLKFGKTPELINIDQGNDALYKAINNIDKLKDIPLSYDLNDFLLEKADDIDKIMGKEVADVIKNYNGQGNEYATEHDATQNFHDKTEQEHDEVRQVNLDMNELYAFSNDNEPEIIVEERDDYIPSGVDEEQMRKIDEAEMEMSL